MDTLAALRSGSPDIAPVLQAGCHLVLTPPPSPVMGEAAKHPLDLRSPAELAAATLAAREVERARGNPRWAEATAGSGWKANTSDPATWDGWLDRWAATGTPGTPNVGLVIGPSPVVVIDTDNAADCTAFESLYRELTGQPCPPRTTASPGAQNADGTWAHRDGGHYYFWRPAPIPDSWKGNGHLLHRRGDAEGGPLDVSVFVHGRYVLIPPSVRREGAYRWTGAIHPMPPELWERIGRTLDRTIYQQEKRRIAQKRREARGGGSATDARFQESVRAWGREYPWAFLMQDAGWSEGGTDRCGCTIWTRPGGSSARSAIAHEEGCGHGYYSDSQDPPLHLFTTADDGPLGVYAADTGQPTISKLQALAVLHYEGSMAAAIRAEGLGT